MSKIVIEVEGGVVQSVYSNDPDTDVKVVDWDNIKIAEDEDAATKEAKLAIFGLIEVY